MKNTNNKPAVVFKDKETGRRLAEARVAKGYTQKEMAEMFCISQPAYQNYEYGREMKSVMIVKVCAVLECSPEWLLGVEGEGQHLPPESKLLKDLKAAFELLNGKGQQKVVGFARDMARISEYVRIPKSSLHNNSVSRIA
ncbi:MAG: helix-turn-helix domain-containing protein [Coriobacteriales bacterium]|jgi:transcriptional regulator with XRE-family HTH domain|nr:helix-turn-helix domain-containing protein [Coriobacteriales bacterium]